MDTYVGFPQTLRWYHCLQLVKYFLLVPWSCCMAQTLGLQITSTGLVTVADVGRTASQISASIFRLFFFFFSLLWQVYIITFTHYKHLEKHLLSVSDILIPGLELPAFGLQKHKFWVWFGRF